MSWSHGYGSTGTKQITGWSNGYETDPSKLEELSRRDREFEYQVIHRSRSLDTHRSAEYLYAIQAVQTVAQAGVILHNMLVGNVPIRDVVSPFCTVRIFRDANTYTVALLNQTPKSDD